MTFRYLNILFKPSNSLKYSFHSCPFAILIISVRSVLFFIANLSNMSLFPLVWLAKCLPTLLILPKSQLLFTVFSPLFLLICISVVSSSKTTVFVVSCLLLALGLVFLSFSSFLKWKISVLIWDLYCFLI